MNNGMRQANAYLRELFLDYFNNYLSVEKIAEHHQMTTEDMQRLLKIGKKLHEEHVAILNVDAKTKKQRREIRYE